MKKRIVITGCSKKDGVGYQLAHELLHRGHDVIATVRDFGKSDMVTDDSAKIDSLTIKLLDLCNLDSTKKFINDVLEEYDYIDVLVNNAANVAYGPVETLSQTDLQTTFQTKVFGPIALIQGFLPSMRKRKQGLLITTSSMFCAMPVTLQGFSAYISALNAFESIQQCLAVELRPWNINVVNFQPGPIATNLAKFQGEYAEKYHKEYEGLIESVYNWIVNNIPFQSAEAVAKIYADIIESDNPNLTYQSSDFGRNFVSQYRDDTSSMAYLNNAFDSLQDYLEKHS